MAPEGAPGSLPSVPQLVTIIRSAIISGELVPKQRLFETDLATAYSASRGNIRAALTELTVAGIVERIQNTGARVRAVSAEEGADILEVQAAIESLCARKAAERMTERAAGELRGLSRCLREAAYRGDRETFAELSHALHDRIIEAASHRTAAANILRLNILTARLRAGLERQPLVAGFCLISTHGDHRRRVLA